MLNEKHQLKAIEIVVWHQFEANYWDQITERIPVRSYLFRVDSLDMGVTVHVNKDNWEFKVMHEGLCIHTFDMPI